jgi:hypothetical protein
LGARATKQASPISKHRAVLLKNGRAALFVIITGVTQGFSNRIVIIWCLILLLLSACGGKTQPAFDSPWQADDLRALELPNHPDPAFDLFAAYARTTTADLELRFDVLSSPVFARSDLYLYIDAVPGGGSPTPSGWGTELAWDLLLTFPARGSPTAVLADGSPAGIRPRLIRDLALDSFTMRLSLQELSRVFETQPDLYAFQLIISKPGQVEPEDTIGPLRVDGPPPPARAGLALIFWDTLPSATPIQALRRWNGAHTGPYGQRHGLSVLLREAYRSGIPVVLLDLQHPARLAALDALGGLPAVRELASSGHLILPDLVYGSPETAARSLEASRKAAQQHKINQPVTGQSILYGPVHGGLPAPYQAAFARLEPAGHIREWQGARLIPLPGELEGGEEQINQEGLSTAIRLQLLRAALSPEPEDLVVLGGSMPRSAWGDLLNAGPSFAYLRAHPWIHVLNGKDLLRYPALPGSPDCPDLLCLTSASEHGDTAQPLASEVRAALEAAPDNFFTGLAWQAYLSLVEPTTDQRLADLRASYLGQVGPLLAAARWLDQPAQQTDCSLDLDWDGQPECILSTERAFAVLDPFGARLVFLAVQSKQGPVQIIGQRSQLVVGLGDPLDWRPERGIAGDPQDIPGAMVDLTNPWLDYAWETQAGEVVFSNPYTAVRKVFQLDDQSLRITVDSTQPGHTQIPFVLIDQQTYQPGGYTAYEAANLDDPQGWTWGRENGPQVTAAVQGADWHAIAFTESLAALSRPEDPNVGYSEGFFLPFPMALMEIESPGPFTITIYWNR